MMNTAMTRSLFLIIMISAISLQLGAQTKRTLSETIDIYTKSILNRDLKTLLTTVTDNDTLLFFSTDGTLFHTRKEYVDYHVEWFNEKDWTLSFKTIAVSDGADYGFVNVLFNYRNLLTDGRYFDMESYMTLIFRKENGAWKVTEDIRTPVSRKFLNKDKTLSYSREQEYFFKTVKNRRTIRKFKSDSVPTEHIIKILDAARMVPTSGNQQPWKFLVIRDRSKIDTLKNRAVLWYMDYYRQAAQPSNDDLKKTDDAIRKIIPNVLSAPVYIAVLVDSLSTFPESVIPEGAMAAAQLMLSARALGYGTGYYTTFFPEKHLRPFFNIPDHYKLICFTPLGIPESWPDSPKKKDLDGMVMFEEIK